LKKWQKGERMKNKKLLAAILCFMFGVAPEQVREAYESRG